MADLGNTAVISPTDGSNGSGTQPSWLGSAAPSTIDDAGRALQGAVAREWENRSYPTATGTAPAFVVTYTVAPAALRSGQTYTFTAHAAAVGTDTLNANTLGAKGIKKMVAGVKTATAANDFYTNDKIACVYDGTDMVWTNYPGTTSAASETVSGTVELATDAETQTGTDTARAITPANLTAKEATAANWRANTADRILTTDIAFSAAAEVTLTDAATIAVDMSTFFNAIVTLGGNRTLGQPTNTKVGQSGVIRIVQDGTGSRTLAYHADYKFAGGTDPVLTTTASATDLLFYQVIATNVIYATLVKALA